MSTSSITVASVGDLILDEPDPASFLAPAAGVLRAADVTVGHVEVPHSTSTVQVSTDVPAPPADPGAMLALTDAGFDVVTLAGNHVFDAGEVGVTDTVAHARKAGLVPTGAGADLTEARTPAVVERGGLRIGVLSYNCVGPRESWATSRKAGCAYVHVLTHYELDHASPGGPPRVYTFADPDSLDAMTSDVAALRASVDVVLVGLHKGVGHIPAVVAMYESPVARAAIDAGADAVFGHHAHIVRGIEVWRGKPIFHGLGNFVTVTRALTPAEGGDSAERAAWAQKRQELYGFVPDPDMPYYPFHPESRDTAVATCRFDADGLVEAGIVPCRIDDAGRPVPQSPDSPVVDYLQDITDRARLNGRLLRRADSVVLAGVGRPNEESP